MPDGKNLDAVDIPFASGCLSDRLRRVCNFKGVASSPPSMLAHRNDDWRTEFLHQRPKVIDCTRFNPPAQDWSTHRGAGRLLQTQNRIRKKHSGLGIRVRGITRVQPSMPKKFIKHIVCRIFRLIDSTVTLKISTVTKILPDH